MKRKIILLAGPTASGKTEIAIKLAKRINKRSKVISCINSYHGSTQGAMSIMGFEKRKRAYRPLLPNIDFIEFNNSS